MKLRIKTVLSGVQEISRQMDETDKKRENAAERQRAFLESCKRNSPVQQRIDQSRKAIRSKRPLEK